ncbi:MAG: threonine/serine exporter family protein [Lawsonibacter sp.]|nr:threonine/serine exporter family protein [Lawsonibacter sp.]
MDHDKLLNLGAELGRRLMTSGAEIYRVEESVERLLTAYGLEPQVFAIPNCLIVSVNTPEGHPITRMCRIPAHGTDIELLERCNDLCRRLCRDPLPVAEAQELVDRLDRESRRFSPRIVLLGYGTAAAFFALFFAGSVRDCLSAALCGLAVGVCILYGHRLTGSNLFFRTVVCSAVAASLAFFLVLVGVGQNLEAITIGTLMVLVPGMALTNAMREIMAGDIFSGLNRTAEVILVATAIALGSALPLLLGRGM